MRRPGPVFLLILALLATNCRPAGDRDTAAADGSDNHWCRYEPGTIRHILGAIDGYRLPPGYNFATTQFPTVARVTFGGNWRPTTAIVRHFADVFDTTAARRSQPRDLLQHELNFVEGADTLWLPIQEPLVSDFSHEVQRGDSVNLLVLYAGTFVGLDSTQLRVLMVTDFESARKRWLYAACHPPAPRA